MITLGPVNLVKVSHQCRNVGCEAFDVEALNNFGYPAAKARSGNSRSIATIEDLLKGIVKEVNPAAEKPGIEGRHQWHRSSRIA